MVVLKIVGAILVILGYLILRYFPNISGHQYRSMLNLAFLIGIIMFLAGIVLVVVG